MLLHDIVWIKMQHLRCWITFTLDAFVTVINLICKNIFFYQPFDGFSVINTIKLFAKKKKKKKKANITLDDAVTMKIKILNI